MTDSVYLELIFSVVLILPNNVTGMSPVSSVSSLGEVCFSSSYVSRSILCLVSLPPGEGEGASRLRRPTLPPPIENVTPIIYLQ